MPRNEKTAKDRERVRPPSSVRADDPKRSMDRLATLKRKILKVPKEVVDQLREGSGVV